MGPKGKFSGVGATSPVITSSASSAYSYSSSSSSSIHQTLQQALFTSADSARFTHVEQRLTGDSYLVRKMALLSLCAQVPPHVSFKFLIASILPESVPRPFRTNALSGLGIVSAQQWPVYFLEREQTRELCYTAKSWALQTY